MSEQRAVPEIPEDLSATHSAAAADLNGWMRFTGAETVAMIERIATLTAERDALSATLRQGADAAVDLRKKYEALKLERDGLAQKLADSELAFAHANEVVGKLEADVARLSAPVSEREWDSIWHSTARDFANKLIASRTAPAKETE